MYYNSDSKKKYLADLIRAQHALGSRVTVSLETTRQIKLQVCGSLWQSVAVCGSL